MLPKHLVIQGLYSYKERREINFDNLVSAGIFGIFGNVGSGKSSILDAMTLALFGQVERLNRNDKVAQQILNLQSNEILVEFTFQAGAENKTYKSIYQVRRKPRKKTEVDTPVRTFLEYDGNDWIPLPLEKTEEVLGLRYENFRRTIIIPQGKFAEFLQLRDSERLNMLRDIFRLQEYEIHQQTKRLLDQAIIQSKTISAQLQGMEIPSETQVAAWQEELEKETKLLENAAAEIQQLEAWLKEQEKTGADMKRLKELQTLISQLEEELPKIRQKEEKLDLFEKVYTSVGAEWKRHQSDMLRQKEEQQLYKQVKQELEKVKAATEQLTKEQAEAETNKNSSAELEAEARQLQQLSESNSLSIQLDKLLKESSEQKNEVLLFEKKIEEIKTNYRRQKEKLNRELSELPDLFVLYNAQSLIQSIEKAGRHLQGSQQKIQEAEEKLSQYREAETTTLKEVRQLFQQQKIDYPRDFKSFRDWYQESLQEIQDVLSHLLSHEKLLDFASALEDGKPCPLCGSLHHPLKLAEENPEQEKKAVLLRQKQLDETFHRGTDLFQAWEKHKTALQQTEQTRENLQLETGQWEKEIATAKEQLETLSLNVPVENITTLIETTEKKNRDIKNQLSELENQFAAAEKNEKLLKEKQQALQETGNNIARLKERKEILLRDIEENIFIRYKDQSSEALTLQAEALKAKATAFVRHYEEIREKLHKQLLELASLQERISLTEKNLEKLEQSLRADNEKIQQSAESFGITRDYLDKMMESGINLEELRKGIREFRENYAVQKSEAEKLSQSLAGKTYDENLYTEKRAAFYQQKTAYEEKLKHISALDFQLKEAERKAGISKNLLKELNETEEKKAGLEEIYEILKGNKFLEFVSRKYLVDLVNNANHRFFPITGQSLRLEVTDDGDIFVRDYFNGGELRSVKTLSGGQTFQASLCLALALAESVQQLNRNKLNFFFLDEGFGSLDKESLGSVMDTLRALRKENRVVGMISHVDELREEIGVYLEVKNDPEKGSMIYESWAS